MDRKLFLCAYERIFELRAEIRCCFVFWLFVAIALYYVFAEGMEPLPAHFPCTHMPAKVAGSGRLRQTRRAFTVGDPFSGIPEWLTF
jgi:hypothetical protein